MEMEKIFDYTKIRSSLGFRCMSGVVRLTSAAKTHILHLLRKQEQRVVLFSVEGGGCNGLRYRLEPDTTPAQGMDEDIPLDDRGSVLRVCGKSLLYVIGTEIDLTEDFMGKNFTFDNPNSRGQCGCGATFAPAHNDDE
tara:strand:+ start:410 stop:823 length:414 start_codon:yes stop_codon:yes gene_type:complete